LTPHIVPMVNSKLAKRSQLMEGVVCRRLFLSTLTILHTFAAKINVINFQAAASLEQPGCFGEDRRPAWRILRA